MSIGRRPWLKKRWRSTAFVGEKGVDECHGDSRDDTEPSRVDYTLIVSVLGVVKKFPIRSLFSI